ncbi:MAG: acyl--CoA ligase, partial [Candidatus Omnitrophica bacterium]|nr:acyl--CoA ligase [Candidatus Omnitrophota bacterium]
MEILKILKKQVELHPDKTAIIFKEEKITWRELEENYLKLANSLKACGVEKADRVALYLPNCPEYIYSYLAIWALGAVAVPLDFMLTTEELKSCLMHSEARTLIFKPKPSLDIVSLKKELPLLNTLITCQDKLEGLLLFSDCLNENDAKPIDVKFDESDYAIIFYTSGTTGKPKGVLINYRQLLAPPKSMEFFVKSDLKDNDTALCALPFSHLGGLIYIQNTVCFSLRLILMERFIPLEFLKNVAKYQVNFFWIVPSMYYALLQLKEFETFDLSSLRWIVTFGASNSPDALRRFHQFCPKAHLLNGWGMTETNAPSVVVPFGSKKIESVGRPAPWI